MARNSDAVKSVLEDLISESPAEGDDETVESEEVEPHCPTCSCGA